MLPYVKYQMAPVHLLTAAVTSLTVCEVKDDRTAAHTHYTGKQPLNIYKREHTFDPIGECNVVTCRTHTHTHTLDTYKHWNTYAQLTQMQTAHWHTSDQTINVGTGPPALSVDILPLLKWTEGHLTVWWSSQIVLEHILSCDMWYAIYSGFRGEECIKSTVILKQG